MIEAALFMSNRPVSLQQLCKILGMSEFDVADLVKAYRESLDAEDHGIRILETATGFQIRVKPEYAPSVRTLTPYHDLSRGLLRVLALVAYKQPITQSDIVKIIGNRTYEYVKDLTGRGLIRAEKSGRTRALITTKEFAEYFGLESPEEARKLFEKLDKEERENEGRTEQSGSDVPQEGTE